MIYTLRCPRCAGKATGIMKESGTRGSYREVYIAFRLARLVCDHCKLVREPAPGSDAYELYYKTNFRGHTLWARDERHIDALIEFLESTRSATGTSFEALPKWMITDRAKVVAALRKLRET